ncbi:Na+/H+ antiporter NhaC [Antribacter sp. KLBMP9083]|uniref:Na+/H+ antiporter NhaC n=1 Tax=Antribacter soli TaxID=2910976 RepID=A0AA41U7E8_9MICO|nr:Na+/H+ antiporter NhaC [Antribacter soli]MCF4121978.1 Na+/H+ antiporter NhaC [Antribacter soli]
MIDAVVPVVVLAVLIAGAIALFGLDALDGPVQAALVLCCMVAALIGMKNGHRWSAVQEAGQRSLASISSAVFILLAVGALIATWSMAGTIPTLVSYGIQVLSPTWYYAATAIICGVVAMSIGSSWTTAGTIGVGLTGIAVVLGVSPAITAGAVISGAYLGDKLSPLSETTVLSAQLVKIDLYEHIKRQAWTSLPAFGIALAVFLVLGLVHVGDRSATADADVDLRALDQIFNIGPLTLLPLVLLVFLSVRRAPASLSIAGSALFAGLLALVLQPDIVRDFAGDRGPVRTQVEAIWRAIATGFSIDSGNADVDQLLSRGGMAGMLLTLWLIIGAVTFGTLLEELGLTAPLIDPLVRSARTTGRLFLAVFATAFGLNIVAGDQYLALVLPGRVFRAEFARRGLAPSNLSRLVSDCGTVTSPLVPWNSCGAFMSAALGVSTLLYLPFCVFCIASPVLSLLYGFTGFKVERVPAGQDEPVS